MQQAAHCNKLSYCQGAFSSSFRIILRISGVTGSVRSFDDGFCLIDPLKSKCSCAVSLRGSPHPFSRWKWRTADKYTCIEEYATVCGSSAVNRMSSCSDAGNGGNCSPLQKFTYRVWADLYVLELSLMLPAMRSLATVSNLAIASPILPSPTAATVLAELVLAGGWLLALHCGRPALNYEIVHQPPGSGPLQYDLLLMLYHILHK